MGTAPAAVSAAVVAAAALASGYAGPVPGAGVLVAGLVAVVAAVRGGGGAVPVGPLLAWIAITALAGGRALVTIAGERSDAATWREAAGEGRRLAVGGGLWIEEARATGLGRWSVRARVEGCERPCRGAVARFTWRGDLEPRPGERWAVAGELVPDPLRAPPGSRFPPAGLAPGARGGALTGLRVLERGPPAKGPGAAAEAWIRGRLTARYGPDLGPVAIALVLGDRRGIDPALVDAFAATGTLHLLAVSGLHVGFLAALLALALSLARLSPRAGAGWTILALAAYAGLVGGRPSVVRAAIMAGLALAGRAGERRVSPWQWWGAAAVAMLLWRPTDVFDLGFALSFGSVGGLLALAGPLQRVASRAGSGPVVRWLGAGVIATTAASAGTLAVQSASFGWIAPTGFALNPLAVPLCGIALPLVWVGLLLDAALPETLAAPPAQAAGAVLGALCLLVASVAERAGPWVPGPGGWLATALAGIAAAALVGRRRTGAGALVAAASIALAIASRPPRAPVWEVTWLDVGQGDAIAIRFPDGAAWLVDAGPGWDGGDAGRSTVLPWLRRQGIGSLEWLVTTHPDLDHIGGAGSVLRGVDVERWGSGGPVAASDAYLDLVAGTGESRPPAAEPWRAGRRLERGSVSVDVLHPGEAWVPQDAYASRVPANEGSAVLLLSAGNCRLLLTGDLGKPGEEALVGALGDSLRAGLLHVGHHGSRHSSTDAFLARVRPAAAVVSVGAGNRYGHPHPDALARLARAGATVYRTDRMGSITARCEADGWRVLGEDPYLP